MPVNVTTKLIAATKALVEQDRKRRELIDSKAPGLILRVGARDTKWSWKIEIIGKTHRLELGPLSEWSIDEARTLAIEATSLVRSKLAIPDATWLHEKRTGQAKIPASVEEKATTSADFLQHDFSSARAAYLVEVERTLRQDTFRDYKQLLHDECLEPLADRRTGTITRGELDRIVGIVHRSGRERYAEKLAGVLRTLWGFLGTDLMRHRSGVEPGAMVALRAPKATRRERGAADPAKARQGRYVPSMLELGRIVAIARSGAFDDAQSTAIQLVVFTAQRRRPVVSPWKDDMVSIMNDTLGLWKQPPAHRKTAAMRDDGTDHTVPLPPIVWALVKKQIAASKSLWLFTQYRSRRKGMSVTFMSPEVLTRAFLMMPGVKASPHDCRRAFATHGERELNFSRRATKQILDHARGEDPGDVTSNSYALHDGTGATWPTMRAWVDHVEEHVQKAIDADARLLDVDWLKSEIAKQRLVIMGLTEKGEKIDA